MLRQHFVEVEVDEADLGANQELVVAHEVVEDLQLVGQTLQISRLLLILQDIHKIYFFNN
jgi:hypothetical protein